MTKLQLLKWYARLARTLAYKVDGGENGGGWVRLCSAVTGMRASTKREAREMLSAKLGRPYFDKEVRKPRKDAFLESYEWRRVRMLVLKRDGARCACCGATPADGVRMNVDHVKPRKDFPELALDKSNLQVLCEVCNHGKGNWDATDWRRNKRAANE